MSRRALLIGTQSQGLSGVDTDVDTMDDLLHRRGFAVARCQDSQASRAGIVEAYERLIADTRPGDAVVVYYSGPGGLAHPPPGSARDGRPPAPLPMILPADYDESTECSFRGVTALELSMLHARLAAVTTNATVILDTCHTAHVSRDEDLRVKALYRPAYLDIDDHVARLRQGRTGPPIRYQRPTTVHAIACAADQSAYEYTNPAGRRAGLFTESLVHALTESGGRPVGWTTVIERVRRRVLTVAPNQRPRLAGPRHRLPFDVAESRSTAIHPVVTAAGRVLLPGAAVLGVQAGDEFAVTMSGERMTGAVTALASATVDRCDGDRIEATLRFQPGVCGLPADVQAHQVRAGAPALPVRLAGPPDRLAGVSAAISASSMVRHAGPGDDLVVEVRADATGRLTVRDRVGVLHPPRTGDAAGVNLVMSDLTHLARAAALRALAAGGRAALDAPVLVEWGTVVRGRPRPLPVSDAVVHVGEHLYVRVRNDGADTVYVSLIDIGVAARTTLVTALDPTGVALGPGEEYLVGRDALDGRLAGVPLVWPLELVGTDPRPETILVLISPSPQDVSALGPAGVLGPADPGGLSPVPVTADGSDLERTVRQVVSGRPRDLVADDGPVRYDVHTIGFQLNPAPAPRPYAPAFVLDERPEASVRLAGRRGARRHRRVAVRFDDLLVTRMPATATGDLRLDVLVLTGDGTTRPWHRARTARFGTVRLGDRLRLVDPPVFIGEATDFLDLAVWISWTGASGLALGDMLAAVTSRADPSGPRQWIEAAITSAAGEVAAAAIGTADGIVNVAHGLLSRASAGTVGLYRTSLLAHEDFGVGRHPARGRMRAGDFSLSYGIEDAGRVCGWGIDRPGDDAGLHSSIHLP